MKITFYGATQTVTGSKHLITTEGGKNLLLDCGLFQGRGSETESMNRHFGFDPTTIDYLILFSLGTIILICKYRRKFLLLFIKQNLVKCSM